MLKESSFSSSDENIYVEMPSLPPVKKIFGTIAYSEAMPASIKEASIRLAPNQILPSLNSYANTYHLNGYKEWVRQSLENKNLLKKEDGTFLVVSDNLLCTKSMFAGFSKKSQYPTTWPVDIRSVDSGKPLKSLLVKTEQTQHVKKKRADHPNVSDWVALNNDVANGLHIVVQNGGNLNRSINSANDVSVSISCKTCNTVTQINNVASYYRGINTYREVLIAKRDCYGCRPKREKRPRRAEPKKATPLRKAKGTASRFEDTWAKTVQEVFPEMELLRGVRGSEVYGKNSRALEADIYVPDLNLALEVNGLRWHATDLDQPSSSRSKTPDYHLNKATAALNNNKTLAFINDTTSEDDIKYLLNLLKEVHYGAVERARKMYEGIVKKDTIFVPTGSLHLPIMIRLGYKVVVQYPPVPQVLYNRKLYDGKEMLERYSIDVGNGWTKKLQTSNEYSRYYEAGNVLMIKPDVELDEAEYEREFNKALSAWEEFELFHNSPYLGENLSADEFSEVALNRVCYLKTWMFVPASDVSL